MTATLHGGPVVFDAAIRERHAEVRAILQTLIDRGHQTGELRADLTPVDLILSASLLSRPLPSIEDWDCTPAARSSCCCTACGPAPEPRATVWTARGLYKA